MPAGQNHACICYQLRPFGFNGLCISLNDVYEMLGILGRADEPARPTPDQDLLKAVLFDDLCFLAISMARSSDCETGMSL
jgi:hypothetical protein